MNTNLDKVFHEAQALDAASRLLLAEKILSELNETAGHREEWSHEIHRRIDEIRSGKVEFADAFEMLRETRAQLGL